MKTNHKLPRIFLAVLAGSGLAMAMNRTVFADNAPAPAAAADAAKEPSPKEILKLADEARGNFQGVKWTVDIDAHENGQNQSCSLDVSARGYDFLAVYRSPVKAKGQRILFVDRNMWFTKPGVKKPVPVSSRQKLAGGAAYGDIAATNYADDYDATRLPDDTVDGTLCYLFDLKASTKRSTYDRIKYWIAKDRNVAVKAEYFTVSGMMFKSARFDFDNKVVVGGKEHSFISKITIVDSVVKSNVTAMAFGSGALDKVSDSTFDVNLLMSR